MLVRGRYDPPLLRWLPAVTVPAVIAAGVLAGSLPASAGDPLPAKSPEQVLALIAQHRDTPFSGTLDQTSSLGLPELPQAGPGASNGDTAWLELLTGPHTARIYRDGPDNARIQVLDRLAERDVVRHGDELWFYNSKDNTAAHAVLPAGGKTRHGSGRNPCPPRTSWPKSFWRSSRRAATFPSGRMSRWPDAPPTS